MTLALVSCVWSFFGPGSFPPSLTTRLGVEHPPTSCSLLLSFLPNTPIDVGGWLCSFGFIFSLHIRFVGAAVGQLLRGISSTVPLTIFGGLGRVAILIQMMHPGASGRNHCSCLLANCNPYSSCLLKAWLSFKVISTMQSLKCVKVNADMCLVKLSRIHSRVSPILVKPFPQYLVYTTATPQP